MTGLLWLPAGMALSVAVGLVLHLYRRARRQRRLRELADYLEAASCGQEYALTRVEDEFSLLEDELYKTVSQLRIAREQAQQERRQQADNLADIAHQLKTPLTSMSLMVQLLAQEADAGQREYIRRLGGQMERLEWLTSALLTMSRLDVGAVDFALVPLRFEELAARAAEPVEQLFTARAQVLTVHGGDTLLTCDAYWTAEALTNLLKNCSEHTPPSGQVRLEAVTTPLYMQILVEDSGPGFDPVEIPLLFRRFYRGKYAHQESIGIGLALAKAIVERQGGMIRAENRQEGGARFVLRFYPSL